MKNIAIYILGKYEQSTKIGTWIYYMNYKDAVIKRKGTVNNAQCSIRMALFALYNAIQHVNEPCNIVVHSKAALGFKNPKKSSNKDLILKIQKIINNAGHIMDIQIHSDFSAVDKWEQMYNPSKQVNNNKNNITEYKAAYIEQKINENKDWRAMYSDLMGPSEGVWQAGSGGYD